MVIGTAIGLIMVDIRDGVLTAELRFNVSTIASDSISRVLKRQELYILSRLTLRDDLFYYWLIVYIVSDRMYSIWVI